MRFRSFVGALFVSAVAACGGPTPAPPAPATTPAASAGPSHEDTRDASMAALAPKEEPKPEPAAAPAPTLTASPPTVKVSEPGAAPRKALRYKFKAGVTELAEMDMKMSLALTIGEQAAPKADLPTVRTTMRIDAKEITPEGDLRCTFNAEKVDVLKDVKVDAKVREGLEKELAGLVGMHGKARISTRGVASETEFELPPQASPNLNSQMDTLRDAIRQMYVPFPEEEVGKGAKWEVTSRLPVNGAVIDTKMLYVLQKLDADTVQADVDISMNAPPNQPMRVAALPPGATAILENLTGKGAGKVQPSFSRLVSTGTNKIAMESTFGVMMKGQKLAMKMQSEIAVASRPGKPVGPPAPAAKK